MTQGSPDAAGKAPTGRRRSVGLILAAAAVLAVSITIVVLQRDNLAGGVPASPVEGVVISVDSAGLADVRGFELRTGDGRVLAFVLGHLENGAEFPPGHLAEHVASSSPVQVHFRAADGLLAAYRIEDAR